MQRRRFFRTTVGTAVTLGADGEGGMGMEIGGESQIEDHKVSAASVRG